MITNEQRTYLNRDSREDVRAALPRVLCPRTRTRITVRCCRESQAAAHLVPVLAETCGECPKRQQETKQ